MSKLTDYRALTFDVYGTLIDWETGVLTAFQPTIDAAKAKGSNTSSNAFSRTNLLHLFHELEAAQQAKTPSMPYSQLLSVIHPDFASRLGLPAPSAEDSKRFGDSVGRWPAFPDTVDALRRLGKVYKLVVLSNVDVESFKASNAGPMQGVKFDAVLTAQEIGSYKPDLRNFDYMLKYVQREFGIGKEQVLQTAQSMFHDHHPASKVGIRSSWIVRPGGTMGNRSEEIYDWKFDTLGEMADAVEAEVKGKS